MTWRPVLLVLALAVACGTPAARPTSTSTGRGEDAGTVALDSGLPKASAPARTTSVGHDGPPLPPEPPRLSPLETTCDGKDEDGDGHVDLLIPSGKNACTTDAKGACGHGFTACIDGKAVCETPPPSPEVVDGIDNDCNGVVDDIVATSVRSRALVFGPQYMWADAKTEIGTVTNLLDQAGVAYDLNPPDSDWVTKIGELGKYSLVIIPGYLESVSLDDKMREALDGFAEGGGVVFVMKPMGKPGSNALTLAGLKGSRRAPFVTALRIKPSSAIALGSLNSPEEQLVPLSDDPKKASVDVWTFETDGDTQVVAEALAGTVAGPVATRRRIGRGAVYAWGHDLTTFDTSRCYLNCFEPAGDLLRLLLKDSLREGARGHVVLKHPVPGPYASALVLTHDVSANDAFHSGAWGQPGISQMSLMELRNHAQATYFIATDYSNGRFNPESVERLCRDGFCPFGANSARHLTTFKQLPHGTCKETRVTYGPNVAPTLCGEVRVSAEVLGDLVHAVPHAWRSPHLANNPGLFDVLAENHFTLDSSFGIGDLKYNLPVDTASTPKLQRMFHHRSLFELPIAGEDARDVKGDRIELSERNLAWFESAWEYIMLRNAENAGITTLLVHPSRGANVPDDNIGVKVRVVEQLVKVAQAHGIAVDSLVHFGDHWRARSKVKFDASYDPANGYTGWFQVGDEPIKDLTFEFGDSLESFDAPSCGKVTIQKKLVVLEDKLAAGQRCTFTAVPSNVAK